MHNLYYSRKIDYNILQSLKTKYTKDHLTLDIPFLIARLHLRPADKTDGTPPHYSFRRMHIMKHASK